MPPAPELVIDANNMQQHHAHEFGKFSGSFISAKGAWWCSSAYANGSHGPLLFRLEGMPLGATESEQEYWREELERLQKYAAAQKIRDGAGLKAEENPA